MKRRGYGLIRICSIGLLIYTAVYGALMGLTMQAMNGEPFMGIIPVVEWTSAEAVAETMTGSYLRFLVSAQLATCVYAILLMGMMVGVYSVFGRRSGLGKLALVLQGISTILIVVTYILQFTYVLSLVGNRNYELFSVYSMYNYSSPVAILNMGGYMLFGGISSLIFGLLLRGSRLVKMAKWIFVVYGVMCLIGFGLFMIGNMIGLLIWFASMALFGWSFIFLLVESHRQLRAAAD